jgi:hypothetical protein
VPDCIWHKSFENNLRTAFESFLRTI